MPKKTSGETSAHSAVGGMPADSSYVKLSWNVKGIFEKICEFQDELEKRLEQVPSKNSQERRKIKKWQGELATVYQKMEYIRDIKLEALEDAFQCKFRTPELLVLSFVQPSITNLFMELRKYFKAMDSPPIDPEELDLFIHLPDATKVLAFIGDAVVSLALVQILWVPNISKVGELSKKRAKLASNKHMAKICDRMDIYDYRIHLDPEAPDATEQTIHHVKGTIIEAIFGVIYIESGLEQVISSAMVFK